MLCLATWPAFSQPNPKTLHGAASGKYDVTGGNLNGADANTPGVTQTAVVWPGLLGLSVPNNTALKALTRAAYPVVYRAGFDTAGDGGAAVYVWSASACSLNGGAGDNGLQVQPASEDGCWTANLQASTITPVIWGAVGDGAINDTEAVQAAINAAGVIGLPLRFDSTHLYNVTATLTVATPIDIEGPVGRFGAWTTSASGASQACTWGLTNTSYGTTTMLSVTAVTATIRGLCIDMTNGNRSANPTAGAAIAFAPPSTMAFQTGVTAEYNTILSPYDGITLNGTGYTTACCGAGTTADGVNIERNTIISPADAAISIGKNTANAATVGIVLRDNVIVCNAASAASRTNGIGIALYDGGIDYDGTSNGPEGCNIGVAVIPGTVSGVGQNAQLNPATGVLGDQSATHDLLIQPTTALGVVAFSECHQCWAAGTSATDNEVLVSGAKNGMIEGVSFIGGNFHSGANQTVPVVDIEANIGTLAHIHFTGSDISCWGGGTCTAPLLKINGTSAGTPRNITMTGGHVGINSEAGSSTCAAGISIAGPGTSYVGVTGVDLQDCTTPMAVTGNSATGLGSGLVVKGNIGVLPVFGQANPANPAGTTSTSAFKMMGLAIPLTPRTSGYVALSIIGTFGNSVAGDGASLALVYGTGVAPANGAALTGSVCTNGNPSYISTSNSSTVPYSMVCNVTGLMIGTAYWVDVAVKAVTGGKASILANTATVTEQ